MTLLLKFRKRIYACLLLSLAAHVLFMVWSFFVKFLTIPVPEKPVNVIHVRLARQNPGPEARPAKHNELPKSNKPLNAVTPAELWRPPAPSAEAVKERIEAALPSQLQSLVSANSLPQQAAPSPAQTQGVKAPTRNLRKVRDALVEPNDVPVPDPKAGLPQVDAGKGLDRDFLSQSGPVVPVFQVAPAKTAGGQNSAQMTQQSASGMNNRLRSADLGTALTYELFKYQDPKTSNKYFKLLVKVRDATVNFPAVPKEIVFLTDASASIGAARLKQTIAGLVYSLNHLNPQDRFNILVFKDKTLPFSPVSLPANAKNIKEAVAFLNELLSGSNTDVYGALAASINAKEEFNPSYRVLISDGFPTRGIVDDRQVINEISDTNKGKLSIFAFGGGLSVSPYMLEFVAFKNRGWARFEGREYMISRAISRFYDEIRDPLLLNLRYHISGADEKEVYPRIMPDFFKGSEFVVYGKYAEEKPIFLQMRGNAHDGPKEFVVSADLKDAQAGNKDIARQWAFHKVYYLISQLKYKQSNEELIRQIDELCSYFQIVTPYSSEFRQELKPKPQAKPAPPPASKQKAAMK